MSRDKARRDITSCNIALRGRSASNISYAATSNMADNNMAFVHTHYATNERRLSRFGGFFADCDRIVTTEQLEVHSPTFSVGSVDSPPLTFDTPRASNSTSFSSFNASLSRATSTIPLRYEPLDEDPQPPSGTLFMAEPRRNYQPLHVDMFFADTNGDNYDALGFFSMQSDIDFSPAPPPVSALSSPGHRGPLDQNPLLNFVADRGIESNPQTPAISDRMAEQSPMESIFEVDSDEQGGQSVLGSASVTEVQHTGTLDNQIESHSPGNSDASIPAHVLSPPENVRPNIRGVCSAGLTCVQADNSLFTVVGEESTKDALDDSTPHLSSALDNYFLRASSDFALTELSCNEPITADATPMYLHVTKAAVIKDTLSSGITPPSTFTTKEPPATRMRLWHPSPAPVPGLPTLETWEDICAEFKSLCVELKFNTTQVTLTV